MFLFLLFKLLSVQLCFVCSRRTTPMLQAIQSPNTKILTAFQIKVIALVCMTLDHLAAFGFELGGSYGKLILSVFRLVAIVALGFYIRYLYKKKAPVGVTVGIILIFAGAIGNVIDSAFYGLLFSESTFTQVATFLPEGGGYAGFLHGKVVDMLFFPLFEGTYPSWFPWVGGEEFLFFSPIFNFADSYITIGVIYLLIFQRKFFK